MPQLWDDYPEEESRRGIFEIYKDTKHEWRWRLKAKNGKIIAVSEGYNTRRGCVNGVKSVMNHCETGCYVKEPDRPTYIL